MTSTLAGNLTITGSVANIIVAERAQAEGIHLGFREYARAGIPITVSTLLIGGMWLWLIQGWPRDSVNSSLPAERVPIAAQGEMPAHRA